MPIQILFLLFAAVTLFSAGMVVTVKRMMHAALWLVLSLFGVAGLFALLDVGFFAVVQVVVYIGAIAILIIFAVMLTRQVMDAHGSQTIRNWWLALIAALATFIAVSAVMLTWEVMQAGPGTPPSDRILVEFGLSLVNPEQFVIPFEVASVLLLAALVGAIYVAVERKGGKS